MLGVTWDWDGLVDRHDGVAHRFDNGDIAHLSVPVARDGNNKVRMGETVQ